MSTPLNDPRSGIWPGQRPVLGAVAICALAAIAAVALLTAGARWVTPAALTAPMGDFWMGRSPGWFVTAGMFDTEYSAESGRVFTWTGPAATLQFPHLDRSQPHRVSLRVSAKRPTPGPPPPQVSALADNVPAGKFETANEFQVLTIELPPRKTDGAIVALMTSNTLVPGHGDARALGIVIEQMTLTAEGGHIHVSWYVLMRTGLAVFCCVAGLVLCGVQRRLAWVLAAGTVAGFVALMLLDAAFVGAFIDRLLNISTGVAAIGLMVAVARRAWRRSEAVPDWALAVGIVLCVSAVKLACFTHPQIELRDAYFQFHRAEFVKAGRYFFTSFTPSPGYEFPYGIGLYLTALPFWKFFPSPLEMVALLRGIALGVDALVALGLYAVVRRHWHDRVTAILCAALWPFVRVSAMAIGYANLTNVFAQGVFGIALCVAIAAAAGQRVSKIALSVAGALVAAAFMSHFGTVLIGVPLLGAIIVTLAVGGRGPQRSFAAWLLVLTLAAASISYVVYYSHFTDVYRRTWTRLTTASEKRDTTKSMAAPASLKAWRWMTEDQFSNDFGVPGVPLFVGASAGAVLLARRRRRETLTLILGTWAAVWLVFTALGILTRVEVRANLAAAPMFVCLCAYALGQAASSSRVWRFVAGAGVAAVVWSGVRVWMTALGL